MHNFETVTTISLPSYSKQQKGKIPDEENQLLTNLSVPQLALLLRLMVDTGIIAGNHNVTVLATKTAACIHTRKAMQISSESLRIKYYTPEKAAINILKEYLLRMIGLLRNY